MGARTFENENARPLNGQTALITGASRGIGFAIARKIGQMGARVCICARNKEGLNQANANLRAEGIASVAFVADVSRPEEARGLAQQAEQELHSIDILVNNAGIGRFAPVQALSEEDWDAVLGANLKGVFLMSRAIIPGMVSRGLGHIINISSLAGKNAFPGGGAYCASKWGLQGLTYCMSEELREHGIRVAVVCPGSVATQFSPHSGPHATKDESKMLKPEDVAHAVAMLLTQEPQSFICEILLRPTQKP